MRPLCFVAPVFVLLLGACEPASVLEVRRVAHVSPRAEISDDQKLELGCDPCKRFAIERGEGRALFVLGPGTADLGFSSQDLADVEIRESPGPHRTDATIYDVLAVMAPRAQKRLQDFRNRHPRARLAVSVRGTITALTSSASWPERIWVGRFNEREAAAELAAELRP